MSGPVLPQLPARHPDPRVRIGAIAGAVAVAGTALLSLAPMPYAIMRPGPVRDVLGTTTGQAKGDPMISISKHQTYPTSGQLDMLTVAITGGPGGRVTLPQVVYSWFNGADSVQPVGLLYPKTETRKQVEQENAAQMDSSQENATAAALGELKIPVPTKLMIGGFAEGSSASKTLKTRDQIVAVARHPVQSMAQLRAQVRSHPAGSRVPVTVLRAGKKVQTSVTLVSADGKPALGVLMDPVYAFPFPIKISIQSVGGPSAGTMFALGIVDKLTPGALTGGKHIAGTGAIDADGVVKPIGGIRQKLVGARSAGASWFLAPSENCDEVVGHIPSGLTVVRISTLHEARVAAEKIATGTTTGLPGCS